MRDQDESGVRSNQRKRQKADKILNISIGIILLLIILVGGQLFLSGKTTETVGDAPKTNEESDLANNTDGSSEKTPEVDEEENENDNVKETEGKSTEKPSEPKKTNSSDETKNSGPDTESNTETPATDTPKTGQAEGQWKPIGTVQEEPFAAVYNKDHINWEEMKKAFQYVTGLGEDITIWHVGNGGDHQSAVGVVANYATRTTPFKVRLEWVTNEGWMPVSVEVLEENPYIEKYNTSTTETDTTSSNNE